MAHLPGERSALLQFDSLEEGTTRLCFELTAEELELRDAEFGFPRPVQVELVVRRSLETFALEGRLRWTLSGECCRCLAAVEKDLEASLRLLIQRKPAPAMELEAAADDPEAAIFAPGVKEVDLSDRLRETVIIEMPVRVYCKDDCKGLCPHCGYELNKGPCSCAPRNADPRWVALREIKNS
jgi:uncharacterized protein